MKRNILEKNFMIARNGLMGVLGTVFNMPVLANETYSINIKGAFRLSPLRRWLCMDAQVHLALYFVKHRWVYDGGTGVEWQDFIKSTLSDENATPSTLETVSLNDDYFYDVFACAKRGSSVSPWGIPKHYVAGYNKIYSRWYEIPNVRTSALADDSITFPDTCKSGTGVGDIVYGRPLARLPNFWNTGVPTANLDADPEVYSGSGTMSLVDIAQIQAEYKDDVERDWFARRYADVMAQKWGSNGISMEVDDNQAELLMDWSGWCSGVDVHGTDQASLGEYVGKSQSAISVSMPPRYFNEHGMIWCVIGVRFPSVGCDEVHYTQVNTLTAKNFLGYQEVALSEPPIEITDQDVWSNGTGANSYGKIPYYNWYRYHTNVVSTDFRQAIGFPFTYGNAVDAASGHDYIAYDGLVQGFPDGAGADLFFKDLELGHWQLNALAEVECRTPLPDAVSSLTAGAHHIN